MVSFIGYLKAAAAAALLVTSALVVLEIVGIFYSYREASGYGGAAGGVHVHLMRSDDILINPSARLPNAGRAKRVDGGKSRCVVSRR